MIHGPSWDEVGHLPAGLSHWKTGRFELYRVNPPLIRMAATIPLIRESTATKFPYNPIYTLDRPEWARGRELIQEYRRDYFRLLRISRLSCLPFAIFAFWMIWRWSTDLFGYWGGMLSVTVWGFSPLVLTNAQLITPDIGATALGLWACYAFRKWLLTGSRQNAYVCGLALGCAMLSKFTWIILFGMWPLQFLIHRIFFGNCQFHQNSRTPSALQGLLIFSVGIFVINTCYGFDGSFQKLGQFSFYCNSLTGNQIDGFEEKVRGNRFRGTVLEQIPVPFPREMVQGIDRQKVDFEQHMMSYLRGEWRDHGWWYYYLYGLFVKEPLPFFLLGCMALISALVSTWTRSGIWEATQLLLPGFTLFCFVSSQTGFNHHMRYVLPSIATFAIGIGFCGQKDFRHLRFVHITVTTLVLLGSVASLLNSPHWHAHFNLLVGGPKHGPLHLLDSNVDWGQDILLLEKWAKTHPDQPLDGIKHSLPRALGIDSLTELPTGEVPMGFPQHETNHEREDLRDAGPVAGRYAISVLYIYRKDSGYEYFRDINPSDRVGYTIYIYEISPEEANRLRENLGYPTLENMN